MNKESILALRASVPIRTVTVAGRRFMLRGMTGQERDDFEASLQVGSGAPNLANLRARLLVRSLCDEGGKRLFDDDDADALGELPASILDPLFAVAQKLSGIGKSDIAELLGNSDGAPSGASSSDSL